MLTGSKHRWKMQGTTNILFSYEFQLNGVGKSPLYSVLNSSDFFLTHWLPMTSFPATIWRNFCNNLKRYYLKNGNFFLDFLLHFWNVHKILNHLQKRMSVLAQLFPKLLFPKKVAIERSKMSSFRTPFGNQRCNGFRQPLKDTRHHCNPFFLWISGKLSWKKSALLWS